jgi:1-acyl-sn-glycerol-3-phosphate acyltransferase
LLTFLKLFLLLLHTALCSVLALLFALIDRTHFLYFILTKIFSFGILKIGGVKVIVSGKENLDKKSAYIFTVNHLSLYDIPVLQYWVPNNFSFIFKKELARIPVFGWQLYLGPHIVINRQNAEKAMKSIERAKKHLTKRKISVLLFPEGTRSKSGEIQEFKRGAFHIASQVGFPVVPVSISGTEKLFSLKPLKINSGIVKLHFDKPIPPNGISSRKGELELMQKVRDIIIKNYKTLRQYGSN